MNGTSTGSTANQTGTQNVNNAANSGQSAINSFDPSNYATNTMSGLNGIIGGQNNTQNDYLSAFKNQIASQPTTTQAYQQGQQIYNVQPLQNQANQLTNAVLQAPINDVNAAKGFNYDNTQVQQKQDQDLAYLTPQANAAQNNANTAQQNATNYANLQYEQNQMNILPEQEQGQYLMQQYAAQQTGWTAASQAQLSSLQDKMDQGVTLSADEMQQYTALTQSEQNYQAALTSANAQITAAQTGANATVNAAKVNNQFQTIAPASTLVNTSNGGYQTFG